MLLARRHLTSAGLAGGPAAWDRGGGGETGDVASARISPQGRQEFFNRRPPGGQDSPVKLGWPFRL